VDDDLAAGLFRKLLRLAPDLQHLPLHATANAPGFLALELAVLERASNYATISLGHYWRGLGQVIATPEVTVLVFFDTQRAEAVTYLDAFRYDIAYPDPDQPPEEITHIALNGFLDKWLDVMIMQERVLRSFAEVT
jgi:uncharacterized protein YqiB (DUF1249 family)